MIKKGDVCDAVMHVWGAEYFMVEMPCCFHLKTRKPKRVRASKWSLEKFGYENLKCPDCKWWWVLRRKSDSPFITHCTLTA